MDRDVVAGALHLGARKGLVDAFQLLQADHVRLRALEEGEQVFEALLDGVDVPGGDPHRSVPLS